MNVQTSTIFGSLLIEFNDDGSGILHVIRTDKTFVRDADTGANITAPKLEAVAITQEEANALLGEQFATVAAQVQTLTAERDAKAAELAAKTTELETKAEALTAAEAQIASLQAQIVALQTPTADDPNVVTDLQARLALAQAGLLDQIDTALAALPASDPVKIYYDRALTWHRDNPHVLALAEQFGLSSEQVDALFALAKTLG